MGRDVLVGQLGGKRVLLGWSPVFVAAMRRRLPRRVAPGDFVFGESMASSSCHTGFSERPERYSLVLASQPAWLTPLNARRLSMAEFNSLATTELLTSVATISVVSSALLSRSMSATG